MKGFTCNARCGGEKRRKNENARGTVLMGFDVVERVREGGNVQV